MKTIAIYGGTFDPVHNGHIQTSLSIQTHFNFDSYYFLPCRIPALKPPSHASSEHRIEMLQLAIKNYPQFKLDLREVQRDTPSYMVETLSSLRRENKNASITIIMGYDALLSFTQWHQWEKIIKLANFLVINRTDYAQHPIEDAIKELLLKHRTHDKADLLTQRAGVIYLFDAGHYNISSTEIRASLKKNQHIESNLLPNEVAEYIKRWELYQ